jgi:hypothetical protein
MQGVSPGCLLGVEVVAGPYGRGYGKASSAGACLNGFLGLTSRHLILALIRGVRIPGMGVVSIGLGLKGEGRFRVETAGLVS